MGLKPEAILKQQLALFPAEVFCGIVYDWVSNFAVYQMASPIPLVDGSQKQPLRWLGHILWKQHLTPLSVVGTLFSEAWQMGNKNSLYNLNPQYITRLISPDRLPEPEETVQLALQLGAWEELCVCLIVITCNYDKRATISKKVTNVVLGSMFS